MTARNLLKAGFGLSLLAALICYFDPRQVMDQLSKLDPFFVVAAALLIVVATGLGAINAYLFIDLERRLPFSSFIALYWVSWAFGLVFPGQVGDVASIATLMRRRGLELSASVGRSLADKFVSFALMLAFAVVGISQVPNLEVSLTWIAVPLPFALAIWLYRQGLSQWLSRSQNRFVCFAMRALTESWRLATRYPRRLLLNILLSTLKLALAGGAYWCVFVAAGYADLEFWKVVCLTSASSIVAYLPISFNGIGTVEVAGVVLFGWLGVSQPAVLSGYLSLRILVMLLAWVPSGLWLLFVTSRP